MKTHLLRMLGTLILVLIMLIVLQKAMTFCLNQNMNIKLSYLQQQDEHFETLILGPCESLWSLNPDYFDQTAATNSYNLSLTHSDFEDNLLQLHLYLKNNPSPKTLLYYVTPESMDLRWNTFNTYRFSASIDEEFVHDVVSEKDPTFAKWSILPMMRLAYYNNFTNYKAMQGAKHYVQGRTSSYTPNGYHTPHYGPAHSSILSMEESKMSTSKFVWAKEREAGLLRLINYAKSKGIRVVLFESPIYRDVRLAQTNRNEMIQKLNLLASEQEIPFWVFGDSTVGDSIDNFDSHAGLSKVGAREFSEEFGHYFRMNLP